MMNGTVRPRARGRDVRCGDALRAVVTGPRARLRSICLLSLALLGASWMALVGPRTFGGPRETASLAEIAGPDAFVLIAMPPVKINMALWSVRSLIERGRWRGDVFVVTSYRATHPCLAETRFLERYPRVRLIDPADAYGASVAEPKHFKSLLFDMLPANVTTVMYMDTDIHVTSALASSALFTRTVPATADAMRRGRTNLGLFYDAKGHTFGFCDGCQIYHTGVVLMHRVASEDILRAWLRTKVDEGHRKDQQALQALLARNHTYRVDIFPYEHLAFMKDIPRALFVTYVWGRSALFEHYIGLTRSRTGTLSSGVLSWMLGYARVTSEIASMCPS